MTAHPAAIRTAEGLIEDWGLRNPKFEARAVTPEGRVFYLFVATGYDGYATRTWVEVAE